MLEKIHYYTINNKIHYKNSLYTYILKSIIMQYFEIIPELIYAINPIKKNLLPNMRRYSIFKKKITRYFKITSKKKHVPKEPRLGANYNGTIINVKIINFK